MTQQAAVTQAARGAVAVCTTALIGLTLEGCGSGTESHSSNAPNLTTVRYAFTDPNSPYTPDMVIQANPGMCHQFGVDPSITILKTPAASPALSAGQIDMLNSGGGAAIQAAFKQPGSAKIVARTDSVALVLYGTKDIKTVQNLKGKTVGASSSGSLADLVFLTFLPKEGLTLGTDVHTTYTGTATALIGLATAGAIQGFIQNPPLPDAAVAAGVHEIKKLSGDPDIDPLGATALSANAKFLSKNRAAAKGMLDCYAQAQKQVLASPEAAAPIFAKAASLNEQVALAQIKATSDAFKLLPYGKQDAATVIKAQEAGGVQQYGNFDPSALIDNLVDASSSG
ncbi:ABC transporter substrate-binding protein [Dactylosporangium sp. NPDC000555]|uniref:ABC transporter substrate-binding protein n=1 Tax=Dactylosporangium sp. NPDC000555 TaxID=3154260 RepID=UPI003331A7E5